MNNSKSKIHVPVLLNFRKEILPEANALYQITRQQEMKQTTWDLANSIVTLEGEAAAERGKPLEINALAWTLFEAGRIAGIREERAAQKSKLPTDPPEQP